MNRLLDSLSEYFANRKGLLPLVAILLVIVNGILQFLPITGWIASTNIILHLGIVIAIFGFMLAWAL